MQEPKSALAQSRKPLNTPKDSSSAVSPRLVPQKAGVTEAGEALSAQERDDKVRVRAYHIWLDEGQIHGRDQEHWRDAERAIETEEQGQGLLRPTTPK